MVDRAVGELVLGPTVLGKQGKKGVELSLSKMDDVSGGFFPKEFEVKLSVGAECFDGGYRSERGWGVDNVRVGINRGGLKDVWVNKGDAGVGKQGGVLGGLRNIDVIWAGTGGCKEGEAGDNELKAEFGTGGNSG